MMDKYIGILDKLDELGLSEDTIVVFTTDHGHFFGQHGLQAKGGFHYEDLIKLPFIARYPGRVPAGKEQMRSSPWSTWPLPSYPSAIYRYRQR